MSRARDIADFNASLFADDEISGDKVSGGTIGAGTFNGTIGSSATGGSGLTEHGRIGRVCWVTKEATTHNLSGSGRISTLDSDGWNLVVNGNSSIYSTGDTGITVALAGTYLAQFSVYFYNQTSTAGYMEAQLEKKASGATSYTTLGRTYWIQNNATGGHSDQYTNQHETAVVSLNANDLVDIKLYRNEGSYTIHGMETNLKLIYLDSNTFLH